MPVFMFCFGRAVLISMVEAGQFPDRRPGHAMNSAGQQISSDHKLGQITFSTLHNFRGSDNHSLRIT